MIFYIGRLFTLRTVALCFERNKQSFPQVQADIIQARNLIGTYLLSVFLPFEISLALHQITSSYYLVLNGVLLKTIH